MTVLGAGEAVRPTDEAAARKTDPVRPGDVYNSLLATTGNQTQVKKKRTNLDEIIQADATDALERALKRAEIKRTSTSLAALAQSHAAVSETEAAVSAAREALELSIGVAEDGRPFWLDPSSARIGAEILSRFGYVEVAYEALRRAPVTSSLCVTLASAAAVLGKSEEALKTLAPYENWAVDAFRGYLYASSEEFEKAIGYLRRSLREEPNDPDSLFNLAISLWNVGSVRKATRAALRATRTAPGRRDLSLFYLEMLLAEEDIPRLTQEIASLENRKVVADAELLEIQSRVLLLRKEWSKAIIKLTLAADQAKKRGSKIIEGRVRSNLVRMKHIHNRLTYDQASAELASLVSQFPGNDAVVVNFAEFAHWRHEASLLRKAASDVDSNTTAVRRAYLRHQVATLEGNNDAAAVAAEEWFDLERDNPLAATAALTSIGIGLGDWGKAIIVADYALERFPEHRPVINHAAYVLAMSGRDTDAIQVLEPVAKDDFVLSATLGLAYLANGDVDRGMRLYREAADTAERLNPSWRSLMTAYQGLVVRQLGLHKSIPQNVIEALALAPVPLPNDWQDRPDFLRVHSVCERNGYPWPPYL